jgi:hypothetical protein
MSRDESKRNGVFKHYFSEQLTSSRIPNMRMFSFTSDTKLHHLFPSPISCHLRIESAQ